MLSQINSAKIALHNWLKAEVHWRQKSRQNWITNGDKNTHFFHVAAKARSFFNRIDEISFKGNLTDEPHLINSNAIEYFMKLFQPHQCLNDPDFFNIEGPSDSNEQNNMLLAIPDQTEIKNAIFALKRSSSPGPDGFTGVFFKTTREITGLICHPSGPILFYF